MRGTGKLAARWAFLAVHAVLVLPAVAIWLATASSATREGPDANIGAGIVGLYLLLWGAPWSMTAWLFKLNSLANSARDVFIVGLPLLNLVLHVALVWRSNRRPGEPAGPRTLTDGDR